MRSPHRLRPLVVLALAFLTLLVSAAAPTWAQSDADARATAEALRTRVADLELELKAAKARIAELERRLAEANAKAAAGGPNTGAVPPPADLAATIDESTATASPRALLRALQGEYASAMGPVGGWSSPKERLVYFRALEKWILAANRTHRAPMHWFVRLKEVESVGDKTSALRVVAIDPVNGIELGDSFIVAAPPSLHRRLESGGFLQPGTTFELRGTILPNLTLNVDREAMGPFDHPRFVGPFTEFGFSVDPQSMVAVRLDIPPAPAAPAGGPAVTPPMPPTTPPASSPPPSGSGGGFGP